MRHATVRSLERTIRARVGRRRRRVRRVRGPPSEYESLVAKRAGDGTPERGRPWPTGSPPLAGGSARPPGSRCPVSEVRHGLSHLHASVSRTGSSFDDVESGWRRWRVSDSVPDSSAPGPSCIHLRFPPSKVRRSHCVPWGSRMLSSSWSSDPAPERMRASIRSTTTSSVNAPGSTHSTRERVTTTS